MPSAALELKAHRCARRMVRPTWSLRWLQGRGGSSGSGKLVTGASLRYVPHRGDVVLLNCSYQHVLATRKRTNSRRCLAPYLAVANTAAMPMRAVVRPMTMFMVESMDSLAWEWDAIDWCTGQWGPPRLDPTGIEGAGGWRR
jgi:hypothetical protein